MYFQKTGLTRPVFFILQRLFPKVLVVNLNESFSNDVSGYTVPA